MVVVEICEGKSGVRWTNPAWQSNRECCRWLYAPLHPADTKKISIHTWQMEAHIHSHSLREIIWLINTVCLAASQGHRFDLEGGGDIKRYI